MIPSKPFKHGHASRGIKSTTYFVWKNMLQRCFNKNFTSYKYYGARGVSVCDEWKHFENFLSDMGERPIGLTLDRVDNNGNYTKNNCRWATKREQAANNRRTKNLTAFGQTKPLVIWSEETKLHVNTIDNRIKRGWSIEDALTYPKQKNGAIRARMEETK